MKNQYFKYWSISEPVFMSNEKKFYTLGPFQTILERLRTQLYIGMNFQMIRGPESSGKTMILRKLSCELPVEEWDILYLGTLSSEMAPNSLTHKLLGFLDTTLSHEEPKTLLQVVSSLERLSKSKRKILCLLDISSSSQKLEDLETEITRLLEVVKYHKLPLYLIAASSDEKMKTSASKADWAGDLRHLTEEEVSGYLKWCLTEARLDANLFSSLLIRQLFVDAHGSLLKLSQLAEAQLIDLSLYKSNGTPDNSSLPSPNHLSSNVTSVESKLEEETSRIETVSIDPLAANSESIKVSSSLDDPNDENPLVAAERATKVTAPSKEAYPTRPQTHQVNGEERAEKAEKAEKAESSAMKLESSSSGREEVLLDKKKKDEKNTKKSSTSLISLVSLTKEI